MPNILKIEQNDKSAPVLCLFGYTTGIREELVRLNSKKFRIIIVGSRKPAFLEKYPEVYFLTYKNAQLLPKLQERIDYAVTFLSDNEAVKNIDPLVEKVKKDNSQTLALLRPQTIKDHIDYVKVLSPVSSLRYALLGEIISPQNKTESNLSKIIENAIIKQEIKLTGEGEESVFCITLNDSILGIQRLLFGNFRKEVFHNLFYKKPETILDATHMIARVEPETKIIFSDDVAKSQSVSREDLTKILLEKTGMENVYVDSLEGFSKAMEDFFRTKEEFEKAVFEKIKKRKKKRTNTPTIKAIRFSLISLFAGLFLFVFLNLLFFGLGMLYLQLAVKNISSSNFNEAAQDAKKSNLFLSIIKPTIELTFDAVSLIDSQGQTQQTYRLLRKVGELSEIGGSTVAEILKSSTISESQLLSTIANFSFIYQEGQRINSQKPNTSLAKELKGTYSNLLSLSQVLPVALGFEGEKNYLVLFQNNEELRPTGGFVGSVGDLIVENGKVKEFTIHDVYELDGQLKNHVEPPFVVRRNLQQHLYLRDSNFGLNFQETASKSALIYNLETGKEPAAVIAVNLEVLKEVLKISGPISLPSYNVTVDSDTVSQFLQSTIKENFFPGSTQKKDVLNSVFTQLIQRVEKDPKFNISLVKLLPELLEKKQILIAFSDNSIQKVFSANGYGGAYQDPRTNGRAINDYLYINEANIGVNKVNSLISRTIFYNTLIGPENMTSEATLQLTNASKIDDYKTYLTFVVPDGSLLQKIRINGAEQALSQAITDPLIYEAEGFVSPSGLEIEQYSKDGLTHISFIVTALKNSKTNISISYSNGASKKLSTLSEYSLFLIKQPGVSPFNVKLSYNYPEGYAPAGISADSYGTNFMEKNLLVEDDILIDFTLQKKSH